MEILQIVPRLPPAIDGVGDYAYLLAKQLRAAHDIHTRFVVCDPNWENAESGKLKTEIGRAEGGSQTAEVGELSTFNSQLSTSIDGFGVYKLKERSAAELLRVLSAEGMSTTVLLHYVGYGYQERGCPVWLARGLEKWRKQKAESRGQKAEGGGQKPDIRPPSSGLRHLVTMFHELYAFGPPWRSSFWTSPLQRWLVRRLANASEHCVTNLRLSARVLHEMTGRPETHFTVLPVFSNVGEPSQCPAWSERLPRLVVFGTPNWRRQAYVEHRAALEQICKRFGLTEIVDIGAPCGEMSALSVRRVVKGSLPAELVSQELLSCRAGYFAYPVPYLGKSGIFAAYAAHGLAPVTYAENCAENEDGLRAGEHFLSGSPVCEERCFHVARRALGWYGDHGVPAHTAAFKSLLGLVMDISSRTVEPSTFLRPSSA